MNLKRKAWHTVAYFFKYPIKFKLQIKIIIFFLNLKNYNFRGHTLVLVLRWEKKKKKHQLWLAAILWQMHRVRWSMYLCFQCVDNGYIVYKDKGLLKFSVETKKRQYSKQPTFLMQSIFYTLKAFFLLFLGRIYKCLSLELFSSLFSKETKCMLLYCWSFFVFSVIIFSENIKSVGWF